MRRFNSGPMRPRFAGFSGLGGPTAVRRGSAEIFPMPNGTPGSNVDPYNERSAWGETGQAQGTTPPTAIPVTTPTGPATVTIPPVVQEPFGSPNTPWTNPSTFAAVPITAAAAGTILTLFTANAKRNFLIVQNNCLAGGTSDVTPIFYVNFNQAPISLLSLAIPAGTGVAFDIICPRDTIQLLWGSFTNTSGLMQFGGVAVQGTYAP